MDQRAKADGADCIVYGDCADTEFSGMMNLLLKDWKFDDFVEKFTILALKQMLKNPVDVSEIYESYRKGTDDIDFISFIVDRNAVSAAGALTNAIHAVGLEFIAPYEHCYLGESQDLAHVRSGDSEYLIRELFRMRYPNMQVPEKLPMPRPADVWMKDWQGPQREEF